MPRPMSASFVVAFLQGLWADGVAQVNRGEAWPSASGAAQQLPLNLWEDAWQRQTANLPNPPAFDLPAAWQGAHWLYVLSLLAADRSQNQADWEKMLPSGYAAAQTPGEILSQDLTLAHLPALWRVVRAINPDDPLLAVLQKLAAAHPLSSIGMELECLPLARISQLQESPALWKLYLDRVLETEDIGRLRDPATLDAIRAALGDHPELAPKLAAAAELVA